MLEEGKKGEHWHTVSRLLIVAGAATQKSA
jgi:hypothetical protein